VDGRTDEAWRLPHFPVLPSMRLVGVGIADLITLYQLRSVGFLFFFSPEGGGRTDARGENAPCRRDLGHPESMQAAYCFSLPSVCLAKRLREWSTRVYGYYDWETSLKPLIERTRESHDLSLQIRRYQ
jgi:hypothetical protein